MDWKEQLREIRKQLPDKGKHENQNMEKLVRVVSPIKRQRSKGEVKVILRKGNGNGNANEKRKA